VRRARSTANRFVADFVGDTNFLEGTVGQLDGRAVFEVGGVAVDLPGRGESVGPATLMVRPEFLSLRAPDADGVPGLAGRVANVAFLGNHTRITVTTAAGDVVVVKPHGTRETTADTLHGLGEEVCVWWRTENSALIKE
jgi:spermidine/putrescine transport system ATP-binding protein